MWDCHKKALKYALEDDIPVVEELLDKYGTQTFIGYYGDVINITRELTTEDSAYSSGYKYEARRYSNKNRNDYLVPVVHPESLTNEDFEMPKDVKGPYYRPVENQNQKEKLYTTRW